MAPAWRPWLSRTGHKSFNKVIDQEIQKEHAFGRNPHSGHAEKF
jgi:hypothetical protein